MFIYRRIAFVLLSFFMYQPEKTAMQVLANIHLTFFFLLYLGSCDPIIDKKMNRDAFINEIFFLILCYHQICFTDFVTTARTKFLMGWSFVFISIFNFLWPNLWQVFVEAYESIINSRKPSDDELKEEKYA